MTLYATTAPQILIKRIFTVRLFRVYYCIGAGRQQFLFAVFLGKRDIVVVGYNHRKPVFLCILNLWNYEKLGLDKTDFKE